MKPITTQHAEELLREAIERDDLAAIEAYGLLVDELEAKARKPEPDALSAALWYASLGLRVFAVQPMSKQPFRGSRGFKDATSDAEQLVAMFAGRAANVAIATGHLVDVIDVDGPAGNVSIARTRNLPELLGIVSTPRAGGRHLYIATRTPVRQHNGATIMPGVDFRGLGGYVVVPPSRTEDGTYSWSRLLNVSALVRSRYAG